MRLFKIILYLVIAVILLAVIGGIVLVKFVDPNDFKNQITSQIQRATGHHVVLSGPLSWRFFPSLGVEAREVTVASAPGFKQPLAQIQRAAVDTALLPLIVGNVQIQALELVGAKLHFQRNRQGAANWDVKETVQKETAPETEKAAASQNTSKKLGAIKIKQITIKDADVMWQNDQTGETMQIQKFMFTGKNMGVGEIFPISARFDLLRSATQTVTPVTVQTQLSVDPENAVYAMKDLQLHVGDSKITGYLSSTGETPRQVDFRFVASNLNLDQLLGHPPQKEKENTVNSSRPTSTQSNASMLPVALLQNLKGEGSIAIDKLITQNLTITNMNAAVKANAGVIHFAPMTSKLYGGEMNSQATLDVSKKVPMISAEEVGENINAGPLFKDLTGTSHISGTMNYSANVTAQGQNMDEWLQTLNGVMNFAFDKGALEGVDINYVAQAAVAIFKRQPPPTSGNTGRTAFGKMSLSSTVRNGVIQTNDLLIDGSGMRVTGEGTADLVRQNIDLDFLVNMTALNVSDKVQELQRAAGGIPLTLEGSFSSYQLKPDTTRITAAIGKSFLESETSKVKEKFRGWFGD